MLKNIFLYFSLFLMLSSGFAQEDLIIIDKSYAYNIENLDTYETNLVLEGYNPNQSVKQISIPLSQRATIIETQVLEYNGKKWKKSPIENTQTISTLDFSSFFSGVKYIRYDIPSNSHFKFIFKFKEEHTIFLTKMFNNKNTKYSFQLPEGIVLTTQNNAIFQSNFEITETTFDSSENIHYLIHPENTNPSDYFSDWFNQRISPMLEIDGKTIPENLTTSFNNQDKLTFAKTCFDYVKREIRYVDIENGINALIPRQCEKTLLNKLGDCKDMATLLTAIYRHFGYEAYTAISQTNSRENTFNFPSIGYANHMICALKLNQTWYYLDPTENTCLFGDPSTQTLGTNAFIVDHKTDYFKTIPSAVRSETYGDLIYNIDKENEEIRLNIAAHGKFNMIFQYLKLTYKKEKETIEKLLLRRTQLNWECDSSFISEEESTLFLKTNLSNGMYSKIQNKCIFNTSSFLLPLDKMLHIFLNIDYPFFDTKINVGLSFKGAKDIKIQEEYLSIKQESANALSVICPLNKVSKQEDFLQDSTTLFWSNFISQPLTVSYEN